MDALQHHMDALQKEKKRKKKVTRKFKETIHSKCKDFVMTESEKEEKALFRSMKGNYQLSRYISAVPEIILRGGTFFFQTPPPPGHTRSQSPPDPQDT